jgi:hypothetical protein
MLGATIAAQVGFSMYAEKKIWVISFNAYAARLCAGPQQQHRGLPDHRAMLLILRGTSCRRRSAHQFQYCRYGCLSLAGAQLVDNPARVEPGH